MAPRNRFRFIAAQFAVVVATTVIVPASVQAIGSITDGDVTFAYTNNFATSNNNTVNTSFTGAATGNQTYESWWFYRVSGDTQERAFGNPDAEFYGTSTAYLTWNNPNPAFSAVLGIEVVDNGTNSGNLFQGLTITNTSGANLTIDIFHYSDLEIGGGSGGDSAVLGTGVSGILIDAFDSPDTNPIAGYGADSYAVSTWNSGSSVLRNLTDTNVDNFGNTGLPFNNNDITVGFQWTRTLGVGEHQTFMTQFGSNAALLPESYSAVPEPSVALLMALGLIGLVHAGRTSD